MIAGCIVFAISITAFSAKLIAVVQTGEKYTIAPGSRLVLSSYINSTSGAYFVDPNETSMNYPVLTVVGPLNNTLIANRHVDVYTAMGQFPASRAGNYSLVLANPTGGNLLVGAIFGASEDVFSQTFYIGLIPVIYAGAYSGIASVAIGAVVTVLDRRKMTKMKQFGDMSDLV
ncbi:MAG: hypothetical protein ABI361_08265 [Nitrososphaera sp.]|jgi:hypothetical protein